MFTQVSFDIHIACQHTQHEPKQFPSWPSKLRSPNRVLPRSTMLIFYDKCMFITTMDIGYMTLCVLQCCFGAGDSPIARPLAAAAFSSMPLIAFCTTPAIAQSFQQCEPETTTQKNNLNNLSQSAMTKYHDKCHTMTSATP